MESSSHEAHQSEKKDEEQVTSLYAHLAENHTKDMGVGKSVSSASETSVCDGDAYNTELQSPSGKKLHPAGDTSGQWTKADPGCVSDCDLSKKGQNIAEPTNNPENQSGRPLKETDSLTDQPSTDNGSKDAAESTTPNTETFAASHSTNTSSSEDIVQHSDTMTSSKVRRVDETSERCSSQDEIGTDADKAGTLDVCDVKSQEVEPKGEEIPVKKGDTVCTEKPDSVCISSNTHPESTTLVKQTSLKYIHKASSRSVAGNHNASQSCDSKINTESGSDKMVGPCREIDGEAPLNPCEPNAQLPKSTSAVTTNTPVVTSVGFLSGDQSEEDSGDESVLHIDEDNVLEESRTSLNATGDVKEQGSTKDKKVDSESSSNKSGGGSGPHGGQSETSTNPQTEGIPLGSDGKSILPSDSIRLRDLKIKLEKFKEINRTWQKRKPEIDSEKSAQSIPTLTRTNIFDAFSASLPSTSKILTDPNLSEPDGVDENLVNDSQDTSSTSNNNSEQANFTDRLKKAPKVSSNEEKQEINLQGFPIQTGGAIVSSDKRTTVGNCGAIPALRELETHKNLLGVTPVPQSVQQVKDRVSETNLADSVKVTTEAASKCHSATKVNRAESGGTTNLDSGPELVKTSVLPKLSEDQSPIEHDMAARKGCEKTPSISPTTCAQTAEESLDDEDQSMRIAEIFTLHQNPEKSTTPARNGDTAVHREKSTLSSKPLGTVPNESLLDILNKSADDPSTPLMRTPQKPAEVNWPDFGVKRCPRCSFTTSDDAFLQVHTCKRSTNRTPASSIEKPSLTRELLKSNCGVLTGINPDTQSQENSKDSDLSSASPVTKKKIYMPPPSPKIQSDMSCRIVRVDKTLYMCTRCKYRSSYALFIGHLVEHMIEYPYSCPYCTSPGILYFQRCTDVTAHINTHQNVPHKFGMLGYSAAKKILDRLAQSGEETLPNVWIDPSREVSEIASGAASQQPSVVQSCMSPVRTMSQILPNVSTVNSSAQPYFSSVPVTDNISTTPVSSVTFSHTLVSPPATGTSSLSTAGGIRSFNILRQGGMQVQRPVVPTLLQAGPVAGNPLLLFVPSTTVGQGAVVQQTATLPTVIPSVSMENVARLPLNQTVSSAQMQQLSATNLQQNNHRGRSEGSVLTFTPSSASRPRPAIQQNSPRSTSIPKKPHNAKGAPVTIGRTRDKMFCFGCNYKTVSVTEFKNHIWKHLHGNKPHCHHQKGQKNTSMTSCPFVDKIYAAVPVLNSGNISSNESQEPFKSSTTESQEDNTSKVESVLVKAEKKDDNSVADEDDNDCEIISAGRPKPVCIDLTEDEPSSYVEATENQEQEGENNLSQSSHFLSTENSTAVDNAEETTENQKQEGKNNLMIQSSHSLSTENSTAVDNAEETTENQKQEGKNNLMIQSSHSLSTENSTAVDNAEETTENQKQEGETNLMIQSSHSLNTENSTAVDNGAPASEGCATKVTNSEPERITEPERSSQNNAVKDSMFYVCGFSSCPFSCITSEQFKHHLLINHRGANQYPCAHCGHKSPGEEELFRHMLSHTSAKVFVLYKCGFTKCRFWTNLISEFQQHNHIFHQDAESFTCASCQSNYSSLAALCSHFAANLLKFVQCPYCSVKSKDRRTILQHIGQTHPDKPRQITVTSQLVCNSINREKKSSAGKSQEVPNKAVDDSERNQEAPIVKSSDTTGKVTSDSISTMPTPLSEGKYFRCLKCSKVYKSGTELIKHYGNSHKGPHELTIYDCKFCKFSTNETLHMECHMTDTHPNEVLLYKSTNRFVPSKEFKCQICSHVTFCPDQLLEHFKSHEVVQVQFEFPSLDTTAMRKVSKFTCPKCQMNFERYAKLVIHTYNKHTDVKSIQIYKCELCAFLSTSLRGTAQHYNRAHTGEPKILRFQRFLNRATESNTTPPESSEHDFSVHWFHCDNCTFSSSVREDFLEHVKSHNTGDDSHATTEGNRRVDEDSERNESVDIPPDMKCPQCEYTTKVKVNLLRHMKHHKARDASSSIDVNFKDLPWKLSPAGTVPGNDLSSPNEGKQSSLDLRRLQPDNQIPDRSPNFSKGGKYDIHPTGSPTKPGQEFYKCRLCSFKASNIQSLLGHLSSHKSNAQQKCSYCSYKCTNKSAMIKHLKKRHKNMPRKYDKATKPLHGNTKSPDGKQSVGKKRKASDTRDTPSKKAKGNATDTTAYECVLCGFKTKIITALEEHFKNSHDVKAFVCSRCKFQTLKLLEMGEHLETVHNQKQMLYKMSDVNDGDGVRTKQNMKCGLCSSITASRSALIEHSLFKHGVDVEPVMSPVQVHKCAACGRRFRHKQDAKKHNDRCIKRVLKESEETAAVDSGSRDETKSPSRAGDSLKDKSTSITTSPVVRSPGSLNSENYEMSPASSTEKYKYFCDLCEHSGLSRQRMKEHYYVLHFKYNPYKCVYCPKRVHRLDRLQRHISYVHPGKVLDHKLCKNEQLELKIERLLKEKRKLVSDLESSATNACTVSVAEGTAGSAKKQNLKAEKSSSQVSISGENTFLATKRSYDPSNPFHCEHCNFTTRKKSGLQKHMVLHGPPKIKCHVCNYTGHFPYLMRRHYERWHPGEEMTFIRIQRDNYTLDDSPSLLAEASLPGDSDLPDSESSKSTHGDHTPGTKRKAEGSTDGLDNFRIIADEDSESKILAHLPLQELYEKYQDETGKTVFKCLICSLCSHTSGLIATHMYKHMPKCFQCCYCDYRAYPSFNVTSHMKRAHEGETRRFKFFEDLALQKYNQMLATIGKSPFEMSRAKKPKLSMDIREGVESNSNDGSDTEKSSKFKITMDSKKWKSSIDQERKVLDNGRINFCCHLCKFKIPDMDLFGEHLSLHEAFMKPNKRNESAKCGFCSFSSANVKEFNDHVSTHVSERPFKCLRCGYSCFTKAHMRNHIKSKHPGEKMSYSEKSPERTILVRESTPVDSTCLNFEPCVEIRDILFLETAVFDRLASSFGITTANLHDLSNDKFKAVLRASGLTDEDIYSDIETKGSLSTGSHKNGT